jgi:acetyl esterase/lipase
MTTPEKIVSIATGYMGAKQLFAASRVGLFKALADGALDVYGLAAATGLSRRMVRILADSMAALGLLERAAGRYTLSADAAAYLVGPRSDVDLAPFLGFLNEISYGHWLQFDKTVDTTLPGELSFADGRWDTFIGGVMAYNALHAQMLSRQAVFEGRHKLLDFGGLAPDFSIAAMQAQPALQTTFVYDPDFLEAIQAKVGQAGLAARSRFIGAKTDVAQPEGRFDLVMVNHVIHRFTAEQNIEILRRARQAAAPNARLLLLDFFLDDDPQQRALDALHAAEYLVIDGTVVYPEAEVRYWLQAAGWSVSDRLALPGSPRVLVADAISAPERDYTTLSAEVAALLARGAADAPPPPGPMTAQVLRTAMAGRFETGGQLPAVARISDHELPGGQARVRVYHPGGDSAVPALLWMHGGGWTAGTLEENDLCCRAISQDAGVAVVSVDYRLAPEHPYPAAPNDCYAALCWLAEHGARHGIDASRLVVGGESAGGNLATVLCLMARDQGGPRIRGQLVVSPVYDQPEAGHDSYVRYAEGFGMTADVMRFFFAQYVSDPRHLDEPYLLPARAGDLAGLPPALLMSAEHDVLHDEGEAFIQRLEDAGVAVERARYAGQVHGFFGLNTRLSDAARAHRRASEFLRKVLA